MKTCKYIDKKYLQIVNHLSTNVLKYNRTLPDSLVDALPEDKFFPIVFAMVHEHRAGKSCEPHMRCMFAVPDPTGEIQTALLDVEMGIYDLLPSVEIPDSELPAAAAVAGS